MFRRNISSMAFISVLLASSSLAFGEGKSRVERCKAQEVYLNYVEEPPSMDPNKQVDTQSYEWLGHLYEGLMTFNERQELSPGTAESYSMSPDGLTYTFKIRKNAKWHDGKNVTAQDFVFTFQRLVDPAFASEYSFIAQTAGILNAKEIIEKKRPKEQLGVRAIDDRTLEIKLANPVPFFLNLMNFQAFFPVRKDAVEKYGDKFNTSLDSVIGNGPFKMVRWAKEKGLRLEKANTYWNAAAIKLRAIETPVALKDNNASYNQYATGGFDMVGLDKDRLAQAQKDSHKIRSFNDGSMFYFEINTHANKLFSDKRLRQAMRIGVNRNEYVNKIIAVPGYKTGFGLVPDYMPGSKSGTTYRKEHPLRFKDADLAGAKKLVKEYLADTKQSKMPSFTLLAGDSTNAKMHAEYFQGAFVKIFETEVKIDTVPFKTRLQKMRDGQFDVVMAGWGPDYRDVNTFMDLFISSNENNHTGFADKKYDDLIAKAAVTLDPAKRMSIFAEAEKYLVVEEAVIVATDQAARAYIQAPGLEGVMRNQVGQDPDLRFASWKNCGNVK